MEIFFISLDDKQYINEGRKLKRKQEENEQSDELTRYINYIHRGAGECSLSSN